MTFPSAIDAPGGFLFEWWSVFWDIFIARTNEKHSEPAAAYIEVGERDREDVSCGCVCALMNAYALSNTERQDARFSGDAFLYPFRFWDK